MNTVESSQITDPEEELQGRQLGIPSKQQGLTNRVRRPVSRSFFSPFLTSFFSLFLEIGSVFVTTIACSFLLFSI
ncbi:uncharacterized protein BDW47DRAFT_114262 [Aspergillus candidus]|uniref:Uncharacterized protein n=1 Tax=Aspergillus candidus TaxID=41067 RepID=A0A2I2EY38_ASPCN|nr:hypothetical protein BDW47DRAFT_114262 [Aspergillus candidus]PLB33274.1 hypothetical protein BDW47DRAFT_114262 [Aspergillus candidus]